MTTMPEWLQKRAQLSPGRVALMSGTERWTFGELYSRVLRLSGAMDREGVRRGERVALLLGKSESFVRVAHGVTRLGGVLVPIHHRLSLAEAARRVEASEVSFLVSDGESKELGDQLGAAVPGLRVLTMDALTLEPGDSGAARRIDLEDLHSLIFTSGSSGPAKAVRLTWGNHLWNAVGSAFNLGLREDDRWLACLPFSHAGGLAILLRSVLYGVAVVVHEGFDAHEVNRSLDEDGITIVSLVGAMLSQVLEARGSRPLPPSLRCVLLGGGPVSENLLAACRAQSVPVYPTYGLTEAASQVCTASVDTAVMKPGSAGRPLFPVEIQIQLEGGEVAHAGEPGEILVRGATITSGYDGDTEATAQGLSGGWLHTGDLGYQDHDGDLFVLGRKDDLVVTGGENVSPTVVEQALGEHPAVAEVGVVGLPDDRWGKVLAASVVKRPGSGVSEDDLKRHCKSLLARHEVPRRFRFVDSLPRSALGKLLRSVLMERWRQ